LAASFSNSICQIVKTFAFLRMYSRAGVGNLFAITDRTNYALSLAGRTII